jgi:predicted dienelactone hydrolase
MVFSRRQLSSILLGGLSVKSGAVPSPPYDPLQIDESLPVLREGFVVQDRSRGREVPLEATFVNAARHAPVVLFSHGLGGSRFNNRYLSSHWARRGFVCVFLQHPGSDEAVWRGAPPARRFAALKEAANGRNFQQRVKDVPLVLDALAKWTEAPGHLLYRRLNLGAVGMSGHSFGAMTTQAVSGQRFGPLGTLFTEPRIQAALAISPSAPQRGRAVDAFGGVRIPWLLMTGTEDVAPIGPTSVDDRLAVYPALPPGDKYELVLHGAEHSAFSDRPLAGDRGGRNPNHHRVILAISTAFWDAMLGHHSAARMWLDGNGPRTVLEPDDRWRRK